jgi:hypothetical protein
MHEALQGEEAKEEGQEEKEEGIGQVRAEPHYKLED